MDNVPANVNAEGATDGTGVRSQRVGSTDDLACLLNDALAFQCNGNNGSRCDVLDQGGEERLGREVRVMPLSEFLAHVHELQSPQDIPFGKETFQYRRDQVALHAVWLDHHEGGLQKNEWDVLKPSHVMGFRQILPETAEVILDSLAPLSVAASEPPLPRNWNSPPSLATINGKHGARRL